ncbi:hypothetical protein [uncultured Gemmiger sp.]|uniref:hypothetical protein n=1 Tax=uncultured Gemmiger sp. TaxID=1623490 RepID=UPI00266C6523|nr:hypothetical protein [uncultured Gemmiger sp.]
MSDLYRGVFEESFQEGLRIGMIQVLFWAVKEGHITVEEAAEESEMTVREFREILENPPAWVTQDR